MIRMRLLIVLGAIVSILVPALGSTQPISSQLLSVSPSMVDAQGTHSFSPNFTPVLGGVPSSGARLRLAQHCTGVVCNNKCYAIGTHCCVTGAVCAVDAVCCGNGCCAPGLLCKLDLKGNEGCYSP